MKKIVYHIHQDKKFANPTALFPEHLFENRYVLLQDKDEAGKAGFTIFLNHESAVDAIANHIAEADIVMLYSLNKLTAMIANRLAKDVVVIWRFFGYELYEMMPHFIYTPETSRLMQPTSTKWWRGWGLKGKLRKLLRRLLHRTGNATHSRFGTEFAQAVKRVDFFAGLADMEYDFLARFFPLPPFLQLPYLRQLPPKYEREKDNTLIMGHSRIAYGNHLNMLNILASVPPDALRQYQFNFFFSYGQEDAYTQAIRQRATRFPMVRLIEDFLPLDEFNRIYTKSSALVIYAYRQVAMGNIYTALQSGTKVYLPASNVMFPWLVREGFVLSDVSDFRKDLERGTISLSPTEMEQNRAAWERLRSKYPLHAFVDAILKVCEQKKR